MGNYDDIIKAPPPRTLTKMTLLERAAQFSSFAALSGFEDAIEDVGDKVERLAQERNHPNLTDEWGYLD